MGNIDPTVRYWSSSCTKSYLHVATSRDVFVKHMI